MVDGDIMRYFRKILILCSLILLLSVALTGCRDNRDATDASYFEFDKDTGKITGYDYSTGPSDVVIPAQIDGVDVEVIGEEVFYSRDLTSVDIPNSVKLIEEKAFANSGLDSVEIPGSVWEMEKQAFTTNNLTSVEIGEGVKKIGSWAFAFNKLTSVEIPSSVEVIELEAFGVNKLTSVVIGKNVDIEEGRLVDTWKGSEVFGKAYYRNERAAGKYVRLNVSSDWYKEE